MRTLVLSLALLWASASCLSQEPLTVGTSATTGTSGFLCAGGFSNVDKMSSSSLTDFATFSTLAGVGCTFYLHTSLPQEMPGGSMAGFRISTLNLLDLLASITIETYRDGDKVESASGGSLLNLIIGGEGQLFFKTTKPYDAVRIVFKPLVSVLGATNIYYGYSSPYNPFTTLPLSINNERIQQKDSRTFITWTLSEQADVQHIAVQRSEEGKPYQTLDNIGVQSTGQYSFYDALHTTTAVYRIQVTLKNGEVKYSKTLTTKATIESLRALLPNPMKRGTVVQLPIKDSKPYRVEIRSVDGQLVQQQSVNGNTSFTVLSNSVASNGLYFITVRSIEGESILSQRFFLQ